MRREGKGVWRYDVRKGAGSVGKCKERCGEVC